MSNAKHGRKSPEKLKKTARFRRSLELRLSSPEGEALSIHRPENPKNQEFLA